MRESESRIKTFESDGGRPGIVIEYRNGNTEIHLVTGKSGNNEISKQELAELVQITAAAHKYLQPPTAAETQLG